MYDDSYRKRFSTISAATYSRQITRFNGGNLQFTHIHNHYDFEILIIKSGNARFNIGDTSFCAQSNDVILVNPYEVHSAFVLSNDVPFSYFCITFDLAAIMTSELHPATKLCQKTVAGLVKFHHLIRNTAIASLVLEVEHIFAEKRKGWEFFVTSKLLEIFGHLYENENYSIIPEISKNDCFTRKVYEYLQSNLTKKVTSSRAAETLGYSNSYFCRLFKKHFGQTFEEYVNFHRIQLACELLRKGSKVSNAAFSSGFHNLSYFTRAFKAHMGILPSELSSACKISSK